MSDVLVRQGVHSLGAMMVSDLGIWDVLPDYGGCL